MCMSNLEIYDKKRVLRIGNKLYIFDVYKKEIPNNISISHSYLCTEEKILTILNKCDYGIKHIIYVPLADSGEANVIAELKEKSILGYKSPKFFKCKLHVYINRDFSDFASYTYKNTYFHSYKHYLFIPFYNTRELKNLKRLGNKRNRLSGIAMTITSKIENNEVVDVDRTFAFYTFGQSFANCIDDDGYLKLGDYNTGLLGMTHIGKEHTILYKTLIIDTVDEFRINAEVYKEVISNDSTLCRIYRNSILAI